MGRFVRSVLIFSVSDETTSTSAFNENNKTKTIFAVQCKIEFNWITYSDDESDSEY